MPAMALATEAESAPEASPAPAASSAPGASSAPEASPVPDSSPTPVPSLNDSQVESEEENYEDEYDWQANGENDEEPAAQDYIKKHYGTVGDTSIETGNANTSAAIINEANQTNVSSPDCNSCSNLPSVTVSNIGNGTSSDNSAAVTTNTSSTVQIDNDADVNNNVQLDSDTGNNIASGNVGDSEITTGDANVSGVLITSANNTNFGVAEFNILEDHMGDIILVAPEGLWGCSTCLPTGNLEATNSGNGSDSTNDASITTNNESNITINNDADLVNNFDLIANTGYNDASKNVGDSQITTGDANVAANLINLVNSTIGAGVAFVVNVFGDLIGDIIFPDFLPSSGTSQITAANSGNGSDSDNDASIDLNNENNVAIYNSADIYNLLNIDANTGGNSTSANTGGENSIDTGDVEVNAQMLTIANINDLGTSSEPLWFLLVNNMGTWTGKIIGALTGTNYSGSDGIEFVVGENGEILAKNSGNGSDSTNNATITQNNENNLTINNNANITNNVNITANTGGNTANKNTGGNSDITTGDANVAASIINFVNSNLIGRTVMIGIVNVFGTWFGDAVPPGEDPEPDSQQAATSTGGSSGSSSTGGSNSLSNNNNGNSSNNSTSSSSSSNSLNQLNFASGGGSGTSGGLLSALVGGFKTEKEEGDESGEALSQSGTSGIISFRLNLKLMLLALVSASLLFFLLKRRNLITNRFSR